MSDDTLPVHFTVESVKPVSAGAVLAVASVRIDIGGVEITLHGVTVRRWAGGTDCHAPAYRDPATGRWAPAIVLPPELADAIGAEVFTEWKLAQGASP